MDIEMIRDYCLAKSHVTESFPFDEKTLVFKVMNKMFALMGLDNVDPYVNLKCDPDYAQELRDNHDAVRPGYHMNKKHWNSVYLEHGLKEKLVFELIDHSYELVIKSLPKKVRMEMKIR